VSADQGLEARPLVPAGEPVEDDGVLPDVGVHVKKGRPPELTEQGKGAGRNHDSIAHPADLDQDLAGVIGAGRSVEQHAS
jgi:hypothetical protein